MFLKPHEYPTQNVNEDKEDINLNYSNVIYNPYSALSLQRQKEGLPIYSHKQELFDAIEQYQTVIIAGETGSGKTTQLPQYLVEWGWTEPLFISSKQNGSQNSLHASKERRFKICLVQPRRVTVIKSAMRINEETGHGTVLGKHVGYVIRFDSVYHEELTRIKVVTRGILLREMLTDPLLSAYSVIIMDEVHERTLETDILLGLLKKVLKRRPQLRLIIASATINVDTYRDYFDLAQERGLKWKTLHPDSETSKKAETNDDILGISTATIVNVNKRTYDCDIFYLQKPIPDYIEGTVITVLDILKNSKHGDILAFLTGRDDIDKCIKLLNEKLDRIFQSNMGINSDDTEQKQSAKQFAHIKQQSDIVIFPLYAALSDKDQITALHTLPTYKRKCIFATNIAETSLTINNISYVIDCGYEKIKYYDDRFALEILTTYPISQASAIQRAGRAGRTAHGKVFRLYTEETYKNIMPPHPIAEMVRCDLTQAILHLKAFAINPITFNYIDRPPAQNVISALETLYFLRAITERGKLGHIGRIIVDMPIGPTYARMIIHAMEHNCLKPVLFICAMLQIKTVFNANPSRRLQVDTRKLACFAVKEGDLFTYLNVFNGYLAAMVRGKEVGFCRENYLHQKGIERAYHIYKQLANYIIHHKEIFANMLTSNSSSNDIDAMDDFESNNLPQTIPLESSKNVRIDNVKDALKELEYDLKHEKTQTEDDERFNIMPNPETIMKCIIKGFFQNVAHFNAKTNTYFTLKTGYGPLKIHPDSVLFTLNPPPRYVIFHEIIYSSTNSPFSQNKVGRISESEKNVAYMYDITALPKGLQACKLLTSEMPNYFVFGTPYERNEAQIREISDMMLLT